MNSNKNVINFFDKNIYLCLALSMCGIFKTAKYRKEKVMGNEAGEWIIHGVTWDDPKCIHDVDEAVEYINRVGFLPLFKNEIPGFSLEERTVAEYWWSDDPVREPWRWRIAIAKRHDVLYGKFFAKKAGFISKKWLPVFANYRRDGYDFDALFEDEKAPIKHKNIMKQLYPEAADTQIRKILK